MKNNTKTYADLDPYFSTLVFLTIVGVFSFDNLPFLGIFFKGIMILLILSTLLLNGFRRFNPPLVLMFLFSLYCFTLPEYIKGDWSDLLGINAQTAISVLMASLYAYSIYIYAESVKNRDKIIRWIAEAGLFLGILLTIVVGPGNLLSIHVDKMTDYLSDFGLHSNHMGFCFGLAFMSSFYFYRKCHSKKYLFLLFFNFLFVFFSGSRRALLFCTLTPLIYVLVEKKNKSIIKSLLLGVGVLAFGYFILIKVPFLYDLIGYRIESLFDVLGGGKGSDTTATRAFMIEYGMELVADNPIRGYGLNYFAVSYGEISGTEAYSHNNYVELLVSGGIVLLLLYYSKYIGVFIKLKKNLNVNKQCILLFSLLITLIFSDMASITYYNRAYYAFFGLALACAYGCYEKQFSVNK